MAKALALAALVLAAAALSAMQGAHAVCNMSTDELRECQPAAASSNPTANPSAACCAALAKADLPCLCQYKNSGVLQMYNIDPNRAMALPGKCGIAAPSNC